MKSRMLIALLLTAALVPSAAFAQEPQEKPQPQGNASPRQPSADAQPKAAANVRIQITITDTLGTAAPQKKNVSVIVADGYMGRIRSNRSVGNPASLNVDATPTLRNDGRIQLRLAMEYLPPLQGQSSTRYASIDELVTILLESGKPTMLSEASDPSADRRVTVEVTATVLK